MDHTLQEILHSEIESGHYQSKFNNVIEAVIRFCEEKEVELEKLLKEIESRRYPVNIYDSIDNNRMINAQSANEERRARDTKRAKDECAQEQKQVICGLYNYLAFDFRDYASFTIADERAVRFLRDKMYGFDEEYDRSHNIENQLFNSSQRASENNNKLAALHEKIWEILFIPRLKLYGSVGILLGPDAFKAIEGQFVDQPLPIMVQKQPELFKDNAFDSEIKLTGSTYAHRNGFIGKLSPLNIIKNIYYGVKWDATTSQRNLIIAERAKEVAKDSSNQDGANFQGSTSKILDLTATGEKVTATITIEPRKSEVNIYKSEQLDLDSQNDQDNQDCSSLKMYS